MQQHTLTAHDVLNQARGQLIDLATLVGIDWQKLHGQISSSRTKYTHHIELDKKHKGKVYAYVNLKITKNGIEYVNITFGTHKGGGNKSHFDGYDWLVNNGHVNEKGSNEKGSKAVIPYAKYTPTHTPTPTPTPTPILKADNTEYQKKVNRFNTCRLQFDNLPELTSVEGNYLGAKGFADADLINTRLKYGHDYRGDFIIFAMSHGDGLISGYQKLYAVSFDGGRNKDFIIYPNRKQGSYAIVGDISDKFALTYIAEGYATALTVNIASGCPCIVALDNNNLKPVVDNLIKQGYTKLVIAADNDIKPDGNIGLFSAIQAAAYNPVKITIPKMDGKKCDFDDVRINLGLDVIRAQLDKTIIDPKDTLYHYCQLVEYAPSNQVDKFIGKACEYAGMHKITTTADFKAVYRSIATCTWKRGYSGLKLRRRLKWHFKEHQLKKIQTQNTITDFTGTTRHDATGQNNAKIAGLINAIGTGIICDTRGMGVGKTELMKLVADNALLRNITPVSHADVEQYHKDEGGTATEWPAINNNPARFSALLKELEGLRGGRLQKTVYVCHRTSLTKSASERLGLNYYDDTVPSHYIQSLAACVNSLPKFRTAQFADVLFIDEIRQTLEHVLNGTVKNRVEVMAELIATIKNARLVICADADFNDSTLQWLKSIANKPIHVITQEVAKTGKTIIEIANSGALMEHAKAELLSGGNILMGTDSPNLARQALLYLQSAAGDGKILLLTAENKGDPDQAAFLANPDTECLKYRAVIHTPVISSGVSIVNNHFKKVYASFHCVISPNAMLQTTARVRTVKEIYVCFKANHKKNRPTNDQDLIDGVGSSRKRFVFSPIAGYLAETGAIILAPIDNLRIAHIVTVNGGLNDYRKYFIILAQLKGYKFQQSDMVKVKIKGLAKAAKAQYIESILVSDAIDDKQALSIDRLSAPTQKQSNELHRHSVVKMAGINSINADDVEFYQNSGLSKVQDFELITVDDVDLKDIDRKNHVTKDKLRCQVLKKFIIAQVIKAIGDRSITAIEAAIICEILRDNHKELAASELGNYKTMPKYPIRQLAGFLHKFGYELIQDPLVKGQPRSYKLAVNWQVQKYAKARAVTEWTKNSNSVMAGLVGV